jgi:hypothetical protein
MRRSSRFCRHPIECSCFSADLVDQAPEVYFPRLWWITPPTTRLYLLGPRSSLICFVDGFFANTLD